MLQYIFFHPGEESRTRENWNKAGRPLGGVQDDLQVKRGPPPGEGGEEM